MTRLGRMLLLSLVTASLCQAVPWSRRTILFCRNSGSALDLRLWIREYALEGNPKQYFAVLNVTGNPHSRSPWAVRPFLNFNSRGFQDASGRFVISLTGEQGAGTLTFEEVKNQPVTVDMQCEETPP